MKSVNQTETPDDESSAQPTISVVICTYNRANLLTKALESLIQQSFDNALYEIIIVDNNSSDNTRAVAEAFCRCHTNMRYCFEPQQGLSHARNRGWQMAQAEYVAYFDDDCKVPTCWLEVANEIIEILSPGAFGGPCFACHSEPKPTWFQDHYASHVQGEEARPFEQHEYLDGMNIAFRKSLLQHLGGFDPNLGMSGKEIAYGEETDILKRIHTTLPEEIIYYDPRLYVHHLVRPEETTIRWIVRQHFADGRYSYLVFRPDNLPTKFPKLFAKVICIIGALLLDSTAGTVFRDRTKYPYFQNYLYERVLRYITSLGKFYEHFRHLSQGWYQSIKNNKELPN